MSFSIRNTTEPTQIISSTLVKASQIIADTIVSGITFSTANASYIQGRKLYTINLFTPNDNIWWNGGLGSPLVLRDGTVFRFGFDARVISANVNTVNMLPEILPQGSPPSPTDVRISIGNAQAIDALSETIISHTNLSRLNESGVIVANVNPGNTLGSNGYSLNALAVLENDYVVVSIATQSPYPIVSGTITVTLTYFENLPTDD